MSAKDWSPASWQNKPISYVLDYEDKPKLKSTIDFLSNLPPLVFAGEVTNLKSRIADVYAGNAFMLQGGDCAESFAEFSSNNIRDTFRVILQMAVVLTFSASMPVIKIGRIAGQFAKPRTSDFETIDDVKVPTYRGDIINSMDTSAQKRKADPDRMIKAYNQSAATLNILRAFSTGGYADLHRLHYWNNDFVKNRDSGKKYESVAANIDEAVAFMKACGLTGDTVPMIKEVEFYTSHEALLLWYEQALTRLDSISNKWFNCAAHMVWLGNKTRELENAHTEYLRGIENPIGIKIGHDTDLDELLRLLDRLDPSNEAGKIVLITRMGVENIAKSFPPILRRLKSEGKKVVYSCDPMHGNTIKASTGYKTRPFDKILSEIKDFFEVHYAEKSHPGGIHFEMTGQNVTECIGGGQAITELDLKDRYHTHCDPRLNADQSLEIAFLLVEIMKKLRVTSSTVNPESEVMSS